jgi:hypothetical protein
LQSFDSACPWLDPAEATMKKQAELAIMTEYTPRDMA